MRQMGNAEGRPVRRLHRKITPVIFKLSTALTRNGEGFREGLSSNPDSIPWSLWRTTYLWEAGSASDSSIEAVPDS